MTHAPMFILQARQNPPRYSMLLDLLEFIKMQWNGAPH